MLPLILQRIAATIPVMGVVALTVFALLHLTPGDPAQIIIGNFYLTRVKAGSHLQPKRFNAFIDRQSTPA